MTDVYSEAHQRPTPQSRIRETGCESPFGGLDGLDGLVKRCSDLLLASVFLLLAGPVMLLIAMAIRVTTVNTVIFKQRRYGLDGREIIVYKFRTMNVSDDGPTVRQATKDDDRITPLGRFLRRYSLDELPQLINVLQGRMSLVGPRPHAVAHNELYRELIDGYMTRHRVLPGMTGLAQIKGWRGETKDLTTMQRRVHYDLEYLRSWSLGLDLYIMVKTVVPWLPDPRRLTESARYRRS